MTSKHTASVESGPFDPQGDVIKENKLWVTSSLSD